MAHTRNRYCYVQGLEACKEFPDRPSVAQMIGNNVDVMLGGGQEFLAAVEAILIIRPPDDIRSRLNNSLVIKNMPFKFVLIMYNDYKYFLEIVTVDL